MKLKSATDTKMLKGSAKYVPDKSWKSGTGNVKSGRAKTFSGKMGGKKGMKY